MYHAPTGDFVTSSLDGVLAAAASSATIGTGLELPPLNGVLSLSYDSSEAIGATNGPETISYTSYNSVTGALSGLTRGLAGTVDVEHSSGESVCSAVSSLHFSNDMSWQPANQTWTYASATTITVPSGAEAIYSIGDKIKLTQTTDKYFYVVDVADTTLTVTGGSDYTVADEAITANYYSKQTSPVGFPDWFDFSPGRAVSGGTAPTYTTTDENRFRIDGRTVTVRFSWRNLTGGTAGNGTNKLTANRPVEGVVVAAEYQIMGSANCYETGGTIAIVNILGYDSTTFQFIKNDTSDVVGNDQSSAGRWMGGLFSYEI